MEDIIKVGLGCESLDKMLADRIAAECIKKEDIVEDKLTMIRIKPEDRKFINDISLELGMIQTDVITMIIEAYKKSLK